MKTKLIIFLLIFLIPHCGFSPVYIKGDTPNYKIIIQETNGDEYLNNLIDYEVKRISNSNASKTFYVDINSNYEKVVISKNAKGTVSEYELKVVTKFNIKTNDKNKAISIEEKQIVKNISNSFEQKNYEENVKKNFAKILVRKLNFELIKK
tara:strand:- start:52 stop:504 length:453 start_codon:yes stop_codon:yes gene_type:complete